ncbi:MAG TPA: beta-propeller fold lactonase family protein, partial [Candidatus Tumulicola sp.]
KKIAMPARSHPIAIAKGPNGFAVASDRDESVRLGTLDTIGAAPAISTGAHAGGIAFSNDGATLFVSDRAKSSVVAIDTRSHAVERISTGLHPTDLLVDGDELYVAESDGDSVGIYGVGDQKPIVRVFVGDEADGHRLAGVSPNALAAQGDNVFVSLGAANSIAVLQHHRVAFRLPAGWYPTDIVPSGRRLLVVDGKGEGARPNPNFDPAAKGDRDYIGAIEFGSIRAIDLSDPSLREGNAQGATGWRSHVARSIVRANGPIRHVFFILKENRSYDQVLGDMPEGNGDSKLVLFGEKVTPNQHAIAKRFGLFDNAYADGEVSDAGHNWADAAFANDYVQRYWPPTYGDRRDSDFTVAGMGPSAPQNGYMWDGARRSHVTFRDYGEMTDLVHAWKISVMAPGLVGRADTNYVGWNLDYSDVDRVKEWRREFRGFVHAGTVPALEYLWLPGDHTYGTRVGKPTPTAYVAINDYAVGLIVDEISHSPIWKSSAIFITEDDAQDGADHVSDQRTTVYIVSPYAAGGLQHAHYSTVGILRTIEVMLGMAPLSTYDAMAVPLTAAFAAKPHLEPFDAIAPKVDVEAKNAKVAYGAKISAALDFSRPDAAPPGALREVIERSIAGK